MTQETVPDDVVSQVQQEMDQEQGAAAEAQPLTMEQMQQMMQTQARSYQSQISGLQSRMDKGLDAIRRDVQGWAAQQIGDLETKLGRDKFLERLDPDVRGVAQTLLDEMDRRMGGRQAPGAASLAEAQPGSVETAADAQWNQVYEFVEGMGVKRDDPGVNYTVLSDTTLSVQERQGQFMASLRAAVLKSGEAASSPRPGGPTPKPQPAPTANPPVDRGGGRGTAPVYRSVDDVYDAYLTGRLNSAEDPSGHNEYKRLMANLGRPV